MEEKIQDKTSSSTRRIAKNTLMLYFRQILIMVVSLYTVRVVLNTLGAEDYGIYNVVAGVVTMFSFLSGAMATASQRYFSFALGQDDESQLRRYFSMSLTIYCMIALVVVAVAETFGLWFVGNRLVVPAERAQAVFWVYQASVFSTVCTIVTAPFMASIIAHEDMNIYAYVSVVEVLLKLGIMFLLPLFPADKLVVYGLLTAGVVFVNTAMYRGICTRRYAECRFSLFWDKGLFKELVSYTGWNLFGASVGVFKNQLVNVMLNQFFSPVVNAARGIAFQVNGAVNSFSQGFSTAVRPQIIKSYAGGNKEEMLALMFASARFTFFLMFLFSCPIYFNLNEVLGVWLKNVPDYAVCFTKLVFIDAMIESISYPLGTGIQATGKVKWYQIVVGSIYLTNLPISYIFLVNGFKPEIVFYISICISMVALIARLFFMRYIIQFRFASPHFFDNFIKIFIVVIFAGFALWLISKLRLHFIFHLLFAYVLELLITVLFGLRKEERRLLKDKFAYRKY